MGAPEPQVQVDAADYTCVYITLYKDEKQPHPAKQGHLSQRKFCNELAKRDVRESKSGPAFALHRLKPETTRSNANVESVSGLCFDIDDGLTREEAVAKLRGISCVLYSTHSHNPSAGAIKFRVVVPLSRSLTPSEYGAAWASFNHTRLGGAADPATKDPARLYYLPSCPAETLEHAFCETLDGELLDPDALVFPDAPYLQAVGLTVSDDLRTVNNIPPPVEQPAGIERVQSMLAKIRADCSYGDWRNIVWSLAATGWTCARQLALEWSHSAPAKFDAAAFDLVWESYDPMHSPAVGFGTLIHYARVNGWVDTAPVMDAASGVSGDIKNGFLFAAAFRGKLIYIHETGEWLQFSHETGWMKAPPGDEMRSAKFVVAQMRAYAAKKWQENPEDPKIKRLMAHVERSSSEPKLRAMIELAKSEPGMTARLSDFDVDPWLLGVRNGVFDLTREQLLSASPALLVSKRCAVDYDATALAPSWCAFIDRVTGGRETLAAFLQRFAGYLLTGDVSEQCFAFLCGLGANGKTTFIETLRWILGDYAVTLPTETLMVGRRDPGAASPDVMLLRGARIVVASEVEEGSRFAEASLKSLTGGDAITARNPYGLYVTWNPTHKVVIVGNHRPIISGTDHGIWRRVCLVPFEVTIPPAERDPKLLDKLRSEGAGILNWALEGLREWRGKGLAPPPEIRAAGDAYRTDMDLTGQWLEEHTEAGADAIEPTATLYRAYQDWAMRSGLRTMTRQSFGRQLAERGVKIVKQAGTMHTTGLRLNAVGRRAAGGV